VAVCSDMGSNMYSSQGKGLTNRLQAINKSIIHISDLCHAYHNIGEEATKLFPKYIIDLAKEACNFISRSPQRSIQFKEFITQKRKNLGQPPLDQALEVPRFLEVRWLSLGVCATFITKNWADIKDFHIQNQSPMMLDFTAEAALFISLLSIFISKLNYYTTHFQDGSFTLDYVIMQMKASLCEFIPYILKEPFDKPEKERDYFGAVFNLKIEANSQQIKNITEFQNYLYNKI